MNNLEFNNLIYQIIKTKFPKLENKLEIIIESKATDDQIYGSGIKKYDQLISVIETSPIINEKYTNSTKTGKMILFRETIENLYSTEKEIVTAVTNEISEFLN